MVVFFKFFMSTLYKLNALEDTSVCNRHQTVGLFIIMSRVIPVSEQTFRQVYKGSIYLERVSFDTLYLNNTIKDSTFRAKTWELVENR